MSDEYKYSHESSEEPNPIVKEIYRIQPGYEKICREEGRSLIESFKHNLDYEHDRDSHKLGLPDYRSNFMDYVEVCDSICPSGHVTDYEMSDAVCGPQDIHYCEINEENNVICPNCNFIDIKVISWDGSVEGEGDSNEDSNEDSCENAQEEKKYISVTYQALIIDEVIREDVVDWAWTDELYDKHFQEFINFVLPEDTKYYTINDHHDRIAKKIGLAPVEYFEHDDLRDLNHRLWKYSSHCGSVSDLAIKDNLTDCLSGMNIYKCHCIRCDYVGVCVFGHP